MDHGPEHREPLDEDEPIPGTGRARVALGFGLGLLILIVVFLVWFIATHASRTRPGAIFG